MAAVHVRTWQRAYRGLMADEYLDRLRPEQWAALYTFGDGPPGQPRTTVATDGDDICGFATTGPCRDADRPGSGELYAIYVDPSRWSTGVGRALMAAARALLVDDGFGDGVLWVLAGNVRAERFYRVDGWVPDGGRRLQVVHGVQVDEVRYARPLG